MSLTFFVWISFHLLFIHSNAVQAQQQCNYQQYWCDNGRCVNQDYICDRDNDCGDYSDERNCIPGRKGCIYPDYVKCNGGPCISKLQFCSGASRCANYQSTDLYASCSCNQGETRCNRHYTCITSAMECDGTPHCPDGSDENTSTCGSRSCSGSAFKCKTNKQCIPRSSVCNGRSDCGSDDTSDEHWSACVCQETLSQDNCKCPPGYQIRISRHGLKSCEDINECSESQPNSNLLCSHFCNNYEGGYNCNCQDGYLLKSDNKTCALGGPSPLLLYKWKSVLMVATLDFTVLDPIIIHADITEYDIDSHSTTIYWTSAKNGLIGSQNIDVDDSQIILVRGLHNPGLIAFDWISRNAFVVANTNGETDAPLAIKICNVAFAQSGERECATLHTLEGDNTTVNGMVVSPQHGLLFWTQVAYGSNSTQNGSIWRANMDGSDIHQLTNQMVQNPQGLTIDHVFNRLIWIDSSTRNIESMQFDGYGRTYISLRRSEVWNNVQGVTFYEDQIIWINNGEMFTCAIPKHQNTYNIILNCSSVQRPFLNEAGFPKILHTALQPKGGDSCSGRYCSFICTATGSDVTYNSLDQTSSSTTDRINNDYDYDSVSKSTSETQEFLTAVESSTTSSQNANNEVNFKCICPDGFIPVDENSFNCTLIPVTTTTEISSTEDTSTLSTRRIKIKTELSVDDVDDPTEAPSSSVSGCSDHISLSKSNSYLITMIVVVVSITIVVLQSSVMCVLLRRKIYEDRRRNASSDPCVEFQKGPEGPRLVMPKIMEEE